MKILVVKCGTEILMNGDRLDPRLFTMVAHQIIQLRPLGIATVIVSSAGTQAGRERMQELGKDPDKTSKKILAGIGSRVLLNMWSEAFAPHTDVVQFWLTYQNWRNKREHSSIRSGLLASFRSLLIPVVNENDVVSPQELLKFVRGIGENDQLARMVAQMIHANQVLFLTNSGGVYKTDPTIDPDAEILKVINPIILKQLILSGTSKKGKGGIGVKVKEAVRCARNGQRTAIAGLTQDSILRFGQGESVGTTVE